MPGQVRGLAAPNADRAIFVTSYDLRARAPGP